MSKKFVENKNSIMGQLLGEQDINVKKLRRGDIVEGTILSTDNNQVMVDLGAKAEGVLTGREVEILKDALGEIKAGSKVLVYIAIPEGDSGHAVLSVRRAIPEIMWRELEEKQKNGGEVKGKIAEQNRGGVLIDLGEVKGFIPSSLIDTTLSNATSVGREVSARVVEVDRGINRVILSEKVSALEKNKKSLEKLLKDIEVGSIVSGAVTSILPFGVFINVKGFEGLIPVSELSPTRVENPEEIVKSGDEIKVKVVNIDRESGKITFSLKQAQENPWESAHERYYPGKKINGVVTKVTAKGAFVELEPGITAILPKDQAKDLKDGAEVEAVVGSIEPEVELIILKI